MFNRVKELYSAWRATTLGPLAVPLFRSLWIAALASHVGAAVQTVGASWTMTLLAPSAQMVALVQAAAMLPIVVLALPAGALADTMDRRRLMLASQVIGACAAALLAVLSFSNHVTPVVLLALTALIGATVALHQPAWQASMGDVVPRRELPAAVSLNVLAFNTARSLGPALGGFIIAVASPAATFVLNALSFIGLIVVLALRKVPHAEPCHPPEAVGPAMAAGVRFVSMSPPLQRIFLRGGLFGFGASALQSLLPLLARTRLGGGPMAFGTLMGAFGLGSFLGAVLAANVRASVGGNGLLALATVSYSAATFIVGFSTILPLSIGFAFVGGVAWIFVLTTTRTAVQLSTPRWVVGRAVSLGQMASFGCMAAGAATWGAVADRVGLSNALAIAATFLLTSIVMHRLAPLPSVDGKDAHAHAPPQTAIRAPRVDLDRESGPVVVTIEYAVPAGSAADFVALMTELGRARRRNGATQWRLQQDIDEPSVWIESIESASWTDHVRRLDRYTPVERALAAQAAIFRTTAVRAVRRMIVRPAGSVPLVEIEKENSRAG